MPRNSLLFLDFTGGIKLKADLLGNPSIFRLIGFRMGEKLGTLEAFGGFDDWDVPTNFQEIQGINRWYDEDGGATLFVFGNDGGNYGTWVYAIESKTTSFVQADTDFDRQAPVLWINCDSQLLILPDGKKDAPFSIKLKNSVSARYAGQKLGLNRPTDAFTVTATEDVTQTNWIEAGTYKWYLSYSYGTVSEPNKYGESALSDPVTLVLPTTAGSYSAIVANFSGISSFVQRINIYRTLKNAITPYRIGYIDQAGVVFFYDNFKDSTINTSLTAPIYTGLPGVIRCGTWDQLTRRLYYFGNDGVLRASAAGLPDVHPGSYFWTVGNKGHRGNWVAIIRDNIYCGKEDGIFLITGSVPNLVPKRISDVQCFSRCSVAVMPDGVYFLGKDAGKSRVYKFNGLNAIPVSDQITSVFQNSTWDMHKRAYGRRVGYEYWLNIMTPDTRFARGNVPFNNLLLIYDTRTSGWFPVTADISAMDVLDGLQDNGEIFTCEADPNTSVSKGTFFRYNRHLGTVPLTVYSGGVRLYNKAFIMDRHITVQIPGLLRNRDGISLEKIVPSGLRIRMRGNLGAAFVPNLSTYDDSETLQKVLNVSNIVSETPEEYTALVDVSGVNASLYGTGQWGSAVFQDRLVEERLYNIAETQQPNGYMPNIKYSYDTTKWLEIEGMEVMYNTTDRE